MQAPQDRASLELQWWLGYSFVHQHLSLGLLHQKLRPADLKRCFIRRSPLPYPRGMEGKEAQQDLGAISHASTIISWVIKPRNAPILRRTSIKTKAIRDRQILKHVLDTCITPLSKKFLQERLSQPVCFLLKNIPPLFYLILELLIHL